MSGVYILSDYGKLSKKDQTLVFTEKDGTNTILFPYKTEHLVLLGKVSITADALRLISKYKIETTFLSSNGKFSSKLSFEDGKNVFLRQKQFRIMDDKLKSSEIAKSIVIGKIKNQISFMQRIKRKDSRTNGEIERTINSVKNILIDLEKTLDIEKIRGYEGLAARNYFKVFAYNIQPEWAEFKSRSKNPPKSNVNAVLSFLYTLLMYRIESAIESQGLDCCAGNLHALNYGKKALVFDLMEEFRTPIADAVCCTLFNHGVLKPEDFEVVCFSSDSEDFPLEHYETISESENIKEGFVTENQKGVLLTKAGIKKVIAGFENKMDSLIMYYPMNEKVSYKKIIYYQVQHYKRVINEEEKDYKAYYFK